MAYKRIIQGRKNAPYNLAEFVCDTTADITALPNLNQSGVTVGEKYEPCCAGSHAFVIAGSKHYMLSNAGEWTEVQLGSGGGGGGVATLYADDDGEGNVVVTW